MPRLRLTVPPVVVVTNYTAKPLIRHLEKRSVRFDCSETLCGIYGNPWTSDSLGWANIVARGRLCRRCRLALGR